ncbi:Eco57I restriction-modification methylase domain-containing protein [Maritalea mediterranea]|uniref:site-specific DNA-methyltransferase (adenine-specific) n=1 Tax=Maritalea mediterranea TaxID=2909667 RepID=A0ABS9E2P3_9HYPH|nr:Eco57I restriction-modification methylase domain-containing protein [Maritalea mediterranea]MCF4097131.1 BREX-1 system adenine-specific DNA-methyltransferase PglX [Maritalea mediterranea]
MGLEEYFGGNLFSSDFLSQSVAQSAAWQALEDDRVDTLLNQLHDVYARFPTTQSPNESRTEDDLIWPILTCLGWKEHMRQQNLSVSGRADVPDGLLFIDDQAKAKADDFPDDHKKYQFGAVVVESKRWGRPLDRQSGKRGEEIAPSTQMLRYLRRVDDLTDGGLRWGFLTNGAKWRLYYAGARSRSEQFFEMDLSQLFDVGGADLFALDDAEKRHALKVFLLIFGQPSFVLSGVDRQTFHQRALAEGKFYEERVAANLSELVFNQVFPLLARSLAEAAPEADLQEVRAAALILLYRLLFILYAEDRNLLPVNDERYDDYGLRDKVRMDVGNRKDNHDTFSTSAARYWNVLQDLSRAIDQGDNSIGLPPYNGGLFDESRTPLLQQVRLSDQVMADVIDSLSFDRAGDSKKYINYRDLTVQQLGSIYERLLEHEVVREGDMVDIRPNIFARKASGSYYTPDDLVGLILDETLTPLVQQRLDLFEEEVDRLQGSDGELATKLRKLKRVDPAEKILDLKICDPAMGSGHFLVSLVDFLTDKVIEALGATEQMVSWTDDDHPYISPLIERIERIRNTIIDNAEEKGWTVSADQLDDRHIVRRMVLKRCVYGMDKNEMAVELAKVSLWLHSFTVGAPLSFLDHHLRCGDSLFGGWVHRTVTKMEEAGAKMFLQKPLEQALGSATKMQAIESSADAEIAEAHESHKIFRGVQHMVAPLDEFMKLQHAFDWMQLKSKEDKAALNGFFDNAYGNPFQIAAGEETPRTVGERAARFHEILTEARDLVAEENFFNWQVAFPGVWDNWEEEELQGGFDAVIGNPPWDSYEFEELRWFKARSSEIALASTDSVRKKLIKKLEAEDNKLWNEFRNARDRIAAGTKVLRKGSDYKHFHKSKLNLYRLFVERAMQLIKPNGLVGLLVPSGIASDKAAASFFKEVATEGRLKALYDFENKKVFFKDVHASFKFCVFVAGKQATASDAKCAFFVRNIAELQDPDRCFTLSAEDFARLNPNTGTAPIFRDRRDAEITTNIYETAPVLSNAQVGESKWPVRFSQMLNMSTDSALFRTKDQLNDEEGAWPIGNNRFESAEGQWLPVYEGKMVKAFDHRASDIILNETNVFRPGQQVAIEPIEKQNPTRYPTARYYINEIEDWWGNGSIQWTIAFKDITASTNIRTMIASIIPKAGAGHTLPVLYMDKNEAGIDTTIAAYVVANLNTIPFDYVSRQKVQTTHFSYYILEQLPVIPPERFDTEIFGDKSAGEIVKEAVLELTYTAHDMADFAKDMGYVDETGAVKPPFIWDEERRLKLRAKLDAVFFILYGVTEREDVRYIYSTFPIVEKQERALYNRYRSLELCLAYMNALQAGQSDAAIDL